MTGDRGNSGDEIHDGPGLALATAGIVAVALTMMVAGYGFTGWAILSGLAGGLCLWTGIAMIIAEQRHRAHSRDDHNRS
ncbi:MULTISPECIES: hypothetical protein [unclassified Nocardia]|uniref:hypothetical protein n=1 Tax=unclassified Nocardia TaxID=2637762 RepID=UPI0035D5C83D